MIRTELRYHRPETLDEACSILERHHGDVAVLGGGTQLLPRLNRHIDEVANVVDIQRLNLGRIVAVGGRIHVGAKATYADVLASPELRQQLPLLPKMAAGVTGGRQLTQQATLVGAACFGFPSADVPGVLVALNAVVEIRGAMASRSIPVREFLLGAYKVDLRPGEFVTGLSFTPQTANGYCKVKHSTGSWPIATASAVRVGDADSVTVTLGAVEALPVTVTIDDPNDRDAISRQVDAAVTAPWSDVLATGRYRADIAASVARRAINDLQGA